MNIKYIDVYESEITNKLYKTSWLDKKDDGIKTISVQVPNLQDNANYWLKFSTNPFSSRTFNINVNWVSGGVSKSYKANIGMPLTVDIEFSLPAGINNVHIEVTDYCTKANAFILELRKGESIFERIIE